MPEDTITQIIETAMDDAGIGGGDEVVSETPNETIETPTETIIETADTSKVDTKNETIVDPKVETKTDEIDKLLEAEGYKGGRDNRIPYSRTKKIIENTLKKRTEAHTAEVAELGTKVKSYEERIATYSRADQLFAQDPDRAMQMLVAMHPGKYDKFLKPAAGETKAEPKVKPANEDPKPQPDIKFSDDTVGYSPEQHDKLLEWNRREAKREAVAELKAEYDKRLKPFEDERSNKTVMDQRRQSIQKAEASAIKAYGAEFYKANEADILAALKLNDSRAQQGLEAFLPFRDVVDSVLIPKLRVEKNKVREEVMDEANKRAEAATKTDTKSVKKARDPNEHVDTEDIIRDAIAAAGWR